MNRILRADLTFDGITDSHPTIRLRESIRAFEKWRKFRVTVCEGMILKRNTSASTCPRALILEEAIGD